MTTLSAPGQVSDPRIASVIDGTISGMVAVGNNNQQQQYTIHLSPEHGGVVNFALPDQVRLPQPRPTPVRHLSTRFRNLIDRTDEVGGATSALRSDTPVEFYGPEGLGKSSLLRHLAHFLADANFPDGIVCLAGHDRSVEDLLQNLFSAFYDNQGGFLPREGQLRAALQGIRAVVVLDDVTLSRQQVGELRDAAPDCTFLLASTESHMVGEGRTIFLRGLQGDDALALVARGLGRELSPEERPAAEAICAALKGHPLNVLRAVARVQEEGRSLAEIARDLQTADPAETLTRQLLAALPTSQQQLLAVLAVATGGGSNVGVEHLPALTGLADPTAALEALLRLKLVQAHSPRYSLTGALGVSLRQGWDLTPWATRALTYFTNWAEAESRRWAQAGGQGQPGAGRQRSPEALLEETDTLLRTLEWGVQAGRWPEVLRLTRAMEGALALGLR